MSRPCASCAKVVKDGLARPRSIWLTIAGLRPVTSESFARVIPLSLRMLRTLLPTVARRTLVPEGEDPVTLSLVMARLSLGELTHISIVKIFTESMVWEKFLVPGHDSRLTCDFIGRPVEAGS